MSCPVDANKIVYVVTSEEIEPDYKRPSVTNKIVGVYSNKEAATKAAIECAIDIIIDNDVYLENVNLKSVANKMSKYDYGDRSEEYKKNILEKLTRTELEILLDIITEEKTRDYYIENIMDVRIKKYKVQS